MAYLKANDGSGSRERENFSFSTSGSDPSFVDEGGVYLIHTALISHDVFYVLDSRLRSAAGRKDPQNEDIEGVAALLKA